jgi:hypothetical protein
LIIHEIITPGWNWSTSPLGKFYGRKSTLSIHYAQFETNSL